MAKLLTFLLVAVVRRLAPCNAFLARAVRILYGLLLVIEGIILVMIIGLFLGPLALAVVDLRGRLEKACFEKVRFGLGVTKRRK